MSPRRTRNTEAFYLCYAEQVFLFFSTQCFQKCIHQLYMGHTCNCNMFFPFWIERLNQCYSVNCMKMLAFFHLLSLFWSCRISFFHNKYLVTLSDLKKVTNQCIDDKWIRDTFEEYFIQMLSPVFGMKYERLGDKPLWDGFYFTGWYPIMYGKSLWNCGNLKIQTLFWERSVKKTHSFLLLTFA